MNSKMPARKRIALVSHDALKPDMVAWAQRNASTLAQHKLYGTGTTGSRVAEATGLDIQLLSSGPLGGDQQLGAMIVEGRLDLLIFFIDTLSALPHDVDVRALTRISTLHQVVLACNATSADFVIQSALLDAEYAPPAVRGYPSSNAG